MGAPEYAWNRSLWHFTRLYYLLDWQGSFQIPCKVFRWKWWKVSHGRECETRNIVVDCDYVSVSAGGCVHECSGYASMQMCARLNVCPWACISSYMKYTQSNYLMYHIGWHRWYGCSFNSLFSASNISHIYTNSRENGVHTWSICTQWHLYTQQTTADGHVLLVFYLISISFIIKLFAFRLIFHLRHTPCIP